MLGIDDEEVKSNDAMELSDLHHGDETDTCDNSKEEESRIMPNTDHKPLKAVMRRSNSATILPSQSNGGAHHNSVIYSTNATSEYAKQQRLEKERHQQLENMQRQMELLEQKNLESIKQRRKLTADLESKMRESKFYEKQVIELTNENQHLKAQLESTIRVSSGVVGINTGVVGTLSGTRRGVENNPSLGNKLAAVGLAGKDALAVQELRACREKLAAMETENKTFKIQNNELSMQVKILQDALNFRSEEIGLSGHADLLTKVAKLKGEVTALKNELTNKVDELSSVKETKEALNHEKQDLQGQIELIQQRLAQSQQESYRLANSDVGQLLRSAEQERDLLIEYIQSDMQKSTTLAKQVETLEGELRILRKKASGLEEKLCARDAACKDLQTQLQNVDKEYQILRDQLNQLQRSFEQVRIDRDSFQHQLDRKILEEEELIKAQVTLFSQLKSKDEELLQKSEEFIVLKMKVQEHDAARPVLLEENQNLRIRNQGMEKEVQRLRHIIHELEPKVKSLEPMIPRLEKEMEEYRQHKVQMTLESQELKKYRQLVEDLHKDFDLVDASNRTEGTTLSSSNDIKKREKKSSSFSPSKSVSWISAPSTIGDSVTPNNTNPTLSLSQLHSMWIGLPSLRNLSPILYEKIRHLANDLHLKECESNELKQTLSTVDSNLANANQELMRLRQHSQDQHQHDQESVLQVTHKLYEAENELTRLRDTQHILEQIKMVLLAYPGQKPFTLRCSTEDNDRLNDNSIFLDESMISHGNKKEIDSNQVSNPTSGTSIVFGQINIHQISDIALPDLINQTLLTNAQAALTVRETKDQNQQLLHDMNEIKLKWQETEQRNIEIENQLVDLREKLSIKEKRSNDLDYEFQTQMSEAAELAEKQNALMMTLEAKVEGLQRDRQLRIAQIQALQQREESMKQKIIAHCDYQHLYLPAQFTSNSSTAAANHLAELIGFILDHYMSSTTPKAPRSHDESSFDFKKGDNRHQLSDRHQSFPHQTTSMNRVNPHQVEPSRQDQEDWRNHTNHHSQQFPSSSSATQNYSQQQSDSLPIRHRSSSPVLSQANSASHPRMPYENLIPAEELLRPISTRVSPLKSSRKIASDSFEQSGANINRVDHLRGGTSSCDHFSSNQRFSRSVTSEYAPQYNQHTIRDDLSSSRSGGDAQDRFRRTRLSFSSMKEM